MSHGRPTALPSAGMAPEQVVCAQLDGLRAEPQAGDGAGPGIQAAWAFASPTNRTATGPLDRFAAMLRTPVYIGLLEHVSCQLGPVINLGHESRQEVLVLARDDRTLGFTWVLGLQQVDPYAGCWLTEAVLRHPDRSGPG